MYALSKTLTFVDATALLSLCTVFWVPPLTLNLCMCIWINLYLTNNLFTECSWKIKKTLNYSDIITCQLEDRLSSTDLDKLNWNLLNSTYKIQNFKIE